MANALDQGLYRIGQGHKSAQTSIIIQYLPAIIASVMH